MRHVRIFGLVKPSPVSHFQIQQEAQTYRLQTI